MLPKPVTIEFEEFVITTDKASIQVERVHQWLSQESYWSKNIPLSVVQDSVEHSFCMGAFYKGQQIAYARCITDYTTFAYVADVYVEEAYRGRGLSKKMMDLLMEQDWMQRLRRIMLATLDAHELYKKYGFVTPAFPERFMEISRPGIYGDTGNVCN